MSGNFNNSGKKAVHVKWAGKTIALGTFPAAEADEKCARAKALTRAWRSTMRPKPTRDWVMLELERLGVRVVSGRLGRKTGDEGEEEKKPVMNEQNMIRNQPPPPMDRNNSMGWSSSADLDSLMQRRSSSLGLSLMNDNDMKHRGSIGSLGPALGLDSDPGMPPHRPLVGGGAAAAYEAARADHYAQKREEQQRRASSLGLGIGGGSLGGGSGMPQMGLSVNPNQHYEMLKLHHMNLLNEIQETTLMMNLYQQQQLQQQQQQLQQQQVGGDGGPDPQMAMLLQHQGGSGGMDPMYGNNGMGQRRGTLDLARGMNNGSDPQQLQMLRQQQMMNGGSANGSGSAAAAAASASSPNDVEEELRKGQEEQAMLEERLKKLKDDIARREKEAQELQAKSKATSPVPNPGGTPVKDGSPTGSAKNDPDHSSNDAKRKMQSTGEAEGDSGESPTKKIKNENDSSADGESEKTES